MAKQTTSEPIEIPPLAEIIRHYSFPEVVDLAPNLTLSELLIVGANMATGPNARDYGQRSGNERKKLSYIANRKLRGLSSAADKIFMEVRRGMFPGVKFHRTHVSTYLEKYRFLVSEDFTDDTIFEELEQRVKTDIRRLKNDIALWDKTSSRTSMHNYSEFYNLDNEPVNLDFHLSHILDSPVVLVAKKIKVPKRIAGKISYCMIRKSRGEHRGHEGKPIQRYLVLEDGLIHDILGIQIIVPQILDAYPYKEFIATSKVLEMVDFDDYNRAKQGRYQAIHIDVVLNPESATTNPLGALMNRQQDPIEIILIDPKSMLSANFGPEGYYRRTIAQTQGIVHKHNSRLGSLKIDKFTDQEKKWKSVFESRVYELLTYEAERGL